MPAPSVITIGNFDGVHLGHQEIMRAARAMADRRGARVVAVTFDPAPIAILRPELNPPQILGLDRRIDLLKAAGADEVVVMRPTAQLLDQSAEQFVQHLMDEHQAVGVVEGEDFRFGRGRTGDMTLLAELASIHGFESDALPRVQAKLGDQSLAPISSSLVRWLVGRGRVEDAARCLGRSAELSGEIVQGEQRGRTIGIPTANLSAQALAGIIVPMDGVYAGTVTLGSDEAYPAAISVGIKPTFSRAQLTVEAHLIGYNPHTPDDLYGRHVIFHFAHWLRDQYPFPSVDNLIGQLHRDIQAAALLLGGQDALPA